MSGLRDWQALFLLKTLLMALLVAIFLTIQTIVGELPNSSALDETSWSSVFAAVVLAPIIEELIFRGWLPGKRVHLLGLLCVVMLPALLVLLRLLIGPLSGAQNLLVLIAWFVTSAIILAGASDRSGRIWTFLPLVFWLSNSLFAVAHMLNYKDGFEPTFFSWLFRNSSAGRSSPTLGCALACVRRC